MDNTIDLLQIKIENAKKNLPEETLRAIDAVPWQAEILKLREKKGYSFEQLGDLEMETELLLSGLLSPDAYPRELEKRMRISKAQTDELVNEMNQLVFSRIREELIKNIEKRKIFGKKEEASTKMPEISSTAPTLPPNQIHPKDIEVLKQAGIEVVDKKPVQATDAVRSSGEVLPMPEKLELEAPEKIKEVHPILTQKLSGYVQNEIKETKHSIDNIAQKTDKERPATPSQPKAQSYPPNADPYRLPPE